MFITINLVDTKNEVVEYTPEVLCIRTPHGTTLVILRTILQGNFKFSATANGKEYAFDVELFGPLKVEECKWTNTDRQVQVTLLWSIAVPTSS